MISILKDFWSSHQVIRVKVNHLHLNDGRRKLAIFYDTYFSIFAPHLLLSLTLTFFLQRLIKINGTSVFAKRTRKFLSSLSLYGINYLMEHEAKSPLSGFFRFSCFILWWRKRARYV